jgi:F0F1-type ATP synthase, subunit b
MRKAADDDARRRGGVTSAGTGSTRVGAAETKVINAPQSQVLDLSHPGKGGRKTSIIIQDGKATSGRFIATAPDGRHESFRLKAGDTVIRRQGGETLIRRRVAHKTSSRRQLLIAYAIGYVVIFGLYLMFRLTSTYEMECEDYLTHAFSRRQGETIVDLERAAYEAMRGNRTPAEVRFADDLSFYDRRKNLVKIHAGDRITLQNSAKLARAILDDLRRPPENSEFSKPFKLYEETWLASVDWPYWLMAYNLLGFYLLCGLFLWKPISDFLATQGNKTSSALENVRKAHEHSEDLRDSYRQFTAALEKRREKLEGDIETWAEDERNSALGKAHSQAASIAGSVAAAMATEVHTVREELLSSTVNEACRRAAEIVRGKAGKAEHDAAIDNLINEIESMKLS